MTDKTADKWYLSHCIIRELHYTVLKVAMTNKENCFDSDDDDAILLASVDIFCVQSSLNNFWLNLTIVIQLLRLFLLLQNSSLNQKLNIILL